MAIESDIIPVSILFYPIPMTIWGMGPLSSDYCLPPQARLPVFTGGWAGTVQLVSALDNSNLMPMAAGRVRVHVVSFSTLTWGRPVRLLLRQTCWQSGEPWMLGEWLWRVTSYQYLFYSNDYMGMSGSIPTGLGRPPLLGKVGPLTFPIPDPHLISCWEWSQRVPGPMHAAAKASFRSIGWACQAPHSQAWEGASGTQTYVEGVGPLSSDYCPASSNLMPMAAEKVRVHVVSFPTLTWG